MTGLCGWLGRGTAPDGDALDRMVRGLRAFGESTPNTEASVHDEGALGIASYRPGAAPLFEDERFTVAWVGVLDWATESLRESAGERGDGATIASAYVQHGPAFLDSIRSDAVVALLDRREGELLLAIDRVGIHSLSFCHADGRLWFSTDGLALTAHPDVPKTVDPQSIFDFVYFHVVPGPRSAFQGWRKLGPGEYLLAKGGAPELHKYWKPRYIDRGPAAESDLIHECRDVMRSAVASCLKRADGRVGAFLSGGTDSSTVAGLMTELSGEPANTYSIGFDVPGFDESHYARIAVEHFGTEHHDYLVTADDVFQAAPAIAKTFSEPFGNASAVASLYCARLAKEDGVDGLFAGDGGDEIFAGNERYAKQQLFEHYYRAPSWLRTGLLEPIANRLPAGRFGPLGKAGSYIRQASVPLPDRLQTYNFLSRFPPPEVFSEDFLESLSPQEPVELMRTSYDEAETESVLHRLLYLDIKFTLADNDLRKVGTTCEMAGVQVHYPFLDLGLIDFANRVPPRLKLKGQKLRYFFKRASEGFLPPEILTKSKHGFGVPCGLWMRDYPPLRELAYDSLAGLVRRGYLREAFVDRLKELHAGEHVGYYGVTVWVLTMLELWHQHHVDR